MARLWAEPDWDVLSATQLRRCSRLIEAIGWRATEAEKYSKMPAVDLGGLPKKIRHNVSYYRNRALRRGELSLETARADQLDAAFSALERLHTERWESRRQGGVFAEPRVSAWHSMALPLLERAGMLRLNLLRLAGEVIGVLYALVDPPRRQRRRFYVYMPAHSIRHSDLSPGTLLMALSVEQAAQEGMETIDWLRGEEAYKKMWRTEPEATYGTERYRSDGAARGGLETAA